MNTLGQCLDITCVAVAYILTGINFVNPLAVFVRPVFRKRKLHYMAKVVNLLKPKTYIMYHQL